MKAAVYLHKERQGAVRRGHPWVFPKAIIRQTSSVITGELVDVLDADGKIVGVGVYNEHSLYRVRMLAYAFEPIDVSSITSLVSYRLKQALLLRQTINLPNEQTSAYRLFNSEGDGLSGLTIDRFNQTCVIASSAYWVQAHKESILQVMSDVMPEDIVVWLPQPKPLSQDGWSEGNSTFSKPTVLAESRKSHSEETTSRKERVIEAGVRYEVDFSHTQKTGLFLDQRDNHQRVATLAHGKRILDLYTYTGGFALHAAKAGALKVTAVDSSASAIALAKQNALLNQVDCIEFIEADARDYLITAGEYDLIVLDPPKLAPSQRHVQQAKNYYRFLHREAFKHMRAGSLLLTCNCSAALTTEAFGELVSSQALAVGKIARILGVYGPASCHPTLAAFPEGNYLTAVLIALM
jgi:23S rRNA (cytosine1962-C5)-methyltransferase